MINCTDTLNEWLKKAESQNKCCTGNNKVEDDQGDGEKAEQKAWNKGTLEMTYLTVDKIGTRIENIGERCKPQCDEIANGKLCIYSSSFCVSLFLLLCYIVNTNQHKT